MDCRNDEPKRIDKRCVRCSSLIDTYTPAIDAELNGELCTDCRAVAFETKLQRFQKTIRQEIVESGVENYPVVDEPALPKMKQRDVATRLRKLMSAPRTA